MRLQLKPEGDLFPCCDGTEEVSQSSSNDTPAPERTVCQPCSTGSQLVPPTGDDVSSEEEDDNEEVVSSEVGEGLSEEESEQEEVLEDEEQEEQVENKKQEGEDDEEEDEGDPTVNPTGEGEEATISGKFMANAAPVDESEALVNKEGKIMAGEEKDIAQTKESVQVVKGVQESGEEAPTDPPTEAVKESKEAARKSSVKGKFSQNRQV